MYGITWKVNPAILGLTFLTASPGFGAPPVGATVDNTDARIKTIAEVVAFGVASTLVTKSWLPLVGPVAYLMYDAAYYRMRAKVTDTEGIM